MSGSHDTADSINGNEGGARSDGAEKKEKKREEEEVKRR